MMLDFIVFLMIALPIAWLVSEFQPHRWLRVLLGCASIALAFQVAWVAGSFERFNSNIWYGAASKDLAENTIRAIENGDADKVAEELRVLSNSLEPTYENRANYDKLVENYVRAISDSPVFHAESRADSE
jgi:hypothetical protein